MFSACYQRKGEGRFRHVALCIVALLATPLLQSNSSQRDNFEERVLADHNRVRAEVGVAPLRWDPVLALDAATWGSQLVRTGYLVHSPDDPSDNEPEGENLWAGTRGYYPLESMTGLWADERRHFEPGRFPSNSTTGRLDDVGHYTQMVWRSTTRVGCAITTGSRDDFLVCRYAEGGNVMGERPY